MILSRRTRKAAQRYHFLRSEVQKMSPAFAGAMLSSLEETTIVAGQYTDNQGGACPLLAAARASHHTVRLQNSFPVVWDVFCGIKKAGQGRKATRHEIGILRMLLEERLMPLGERRVSTGDPEIPMTALPQQAPAEATGEESWSCDWEQELALLVEELSLGESGQDDFESSTLVCTQVRTRSFVRSRKVVADSSAPVGTPEWNQRVVGLLLGR